LTDTGFLLSGFSMDLELCNGRFFLDSGLYVAESSSINFKTKLIQVFSAGKSKFARFLH